MSRYQHPRLLLTAILLKAVSFGFAMQSSAKTEDTAHRAQTVIANASSGPLNTYNAATQLAEEHFHDKSQLQAWKDTVSKNRSFIKPNMKDRELKDLINATLSELTPAAPLFFTEADQDFWALTSAFSGQLEGGKLRHIGAWFTRRGKKWFVSRVFAHSPAAAAGLVRGDEIISVDGDPFEPVGSFRKLRPSVKAKVEYRRLPWEKPQLVEIPTVVESFQETMLRDLKYSTSIQNVKGKRVGYIRLNAATHPAFLEALKSAAAELKPKTDALILDLRDSFGGGDLAYLEPFFASHQAEGSKTGGLAANKQAIYDKQLVILVNHGTRGGKEWLAWFAQKQKRGKLVGEATSGAFLANRIFDVVPGHYLISFAAKDQAGSQSNKLSEAPREGLGLTPDVIKEAPLVYTAGIDVQLNEALAQAAAIL